MTLRVLGLVPARGGSKGIPRKNIAPLHGKPLIGWTIEAAAGSKLDRLVLSSDSAEIIDVARAAGKIECPFVRPAELAADDTPAIDVVLHAVNWLHDHEGYTPDAIMLLQPTSPLRRREHIDAAIDLFEAHDADSLVSVVKAPHNMTPESLMRLEQDAAGAGWLTPYLPMQERKHQRQSKPSYYARNGAAIYLVRTAVLLERHTLYGNRILAYPMSREESIDIDEPFDFELCEWLLARRDKT